MRLHDDSVRTANLPPDECPFELGEVNLIVNKPIENGGERRDRLLLFADLSDGERAYLTRMALIHLLGKRESLFLLDEPETHFNDDWKRNLVEQIEQTLAGSESEVILTTHASIVLTDAYPEEVILLTEDGQQSVPLTFAAEQNELLRSVFGADRSVGHRALNRVNEIIRDGTIEQLRTLLDQVGPGYFRFKIIEAIERRVSQTQQA
jgi:ABC-type cobalamin/Fe3+-siderophores transport system ATPase subunit